MACLYDHHKIPICIPLQTSSPHAAPTALLALPPLPSPPTFHGSVPRTLKQLPCWTEASRVWPRDRKPGARGRPAVMDSCPPEISPQRDNIRAQQAPRPLQTRPAPLQQWQHSGSCPKMIIGGAAGWEQWAGPHLQLGELLELLQVSPPSQVCPLHHHSRACMCRERQGAGGRVMFRNRWWQCEGR